MATCAFGHVHSFPTSRHCLMVYVVAFFSLLSLGNVLQAQVADYEYAIIHYDRSLADYGDHTTDDFNDFRGVHLWGDAIDPSEVTEWTSPKAFLGEDEFGRFAWIKRGGTSSQINFIVHRGDSKDGTNDDRFFDADLDPEIWIQGGDAAIHMSQADAQGFVTIRYRRGDGDYGDPTSPDFNNFWGVHLWGDAIVPSEATGWTDPKPPTGIDDFGAFWEIQIQESSLPVNFIIHRGDAKDPGSDESFIPEERATVWKRSGDAEVYPSECSASDIATVHYHRADGAYGNATSPDFNNFWGLHVWEGASSPTSWPDPVRWDHVDVFGPAFEVELTEGAPLLAYILHRGDLTDPGPDQLLVFEDWGCEVWQLEGSDPDNPYVYPIGSAPDATSVVAELPAEFALSQNYPNPFNPTTTISYDLPRLSEATLTIYDVLGREVRELASGAKTAGSYEVSFDATGLPSGIYLYRLQAGDIVEIKRMILAK